MLIAQISDIHLGFEPDNPAEFNRKRLDSALQRLINGTNRPDVLLLTGDLTDHGDTASYRRLCNAISICPFPVFPIVGNHDDRDNFIAHFPAISTQEGFIQYSVDLDGMRLIMLDTLEAGRHGGAFCETRARWLDEQLSAQTDIPTIIVMHHPPVEIGIDWMNTHPEEPWVARFGQVVEKHPQIQAILCGHVHRSACAPWRGTTVAICASTAPQVALDLSPMDVDAPDGRAMIIADPPAYALHRWTSNGLVSHFDNVDDHVMLARFDDTLKPMVEAMMAERP